MVTTDAGVDDPAVVDAMNELFAEVDALDAASTVTSPYDEPRQISADGTIAFAQLDIENLSFEEATALGEDIREMGDESTGVDGLTVEYGGDIFAEFELPESEVYGILAAVIILILAFGSVLAMGLPIGIALFGLGVGTAIVSLASHALAMPDFTAQMVAMIGLGVGIDYALFIVTRYREALHAGASRRGRRRRGDRHQRTGRRVRRHHRDHLAARSARSSASTSSPASPSARPSACC